MKSSELAAACLPFESLLGYHFANPELLVRALTHRSFVNEHEGAGLEHNESLEFLGDAVLGFLISAQIFRTFPGLREGQLSKIKAYLASAVNLVALAEALRLGEFMRLGRGEEKTGGRGKRAILVDGYEAVIGAIFLDGGIGPAGEFVARQIGPVIDALDVGELTYGDFKSSLQERLHDLGGGEPVYRVVDEVGPDHKKTFVVEVAIRDRVVARASGRSKKEAEQAAARGALAALEGGDGGVPPAGPRA